tara:strand:+ start:1156 stop:1353 length:198 start_codon:yes stop_codon:yes gene_type:complete
MIPGKKFLQLLGLFLERYEKTGTGTPNGKRECSRPGRPRPGTFFECIKKVPEFMKKRGREFKEVC